MDNLCHTLMGAALGQAGLKRRSALGMATLLIGANLPDVDVVAVPLGHSLDFRRGWTHGVLALAVLPLLLTGIMLAWDRWVRRRGGRIPVEPVVPRQILLLSFVSILTHPALDYLNTYGMRWLMPFSGRWFYGDAVFIIDPWMWAALAAGVMAVRWGRSGRAARVALAAVTAYAGLMLVGAVVGRQMVAAALAREGAPPARAIMVGPVPVSPFRREVVVDLGDRYRFGALRWLPRPRVELERYELSKGTAHPLAAVAATTPEARRFLAWSRFPFFRIEHQGGGARVRLDDARYTTGAQPSWAAVMVHLPPELAGVPGGTHPGAETPARPGP